MERFIGIDVHKTSCTFAVVGSKGKKIRTDVVETNGRALIEYVKGLPGKKRICLEEGTQARWVYELLKPHATEVAVVNVRQKHANKNDQLDAFALAEDYRLGKFKKHVYKEHGAFGALQAHARLYTKVVRDHVRVQNRLSSMARARAISYSSSEPEKFIKALPSYQQAAAQTLLLQLNALTEIRQRAEEELERQVGKHKISKVLLTAPGFGKKRVAQLMAVVVDPHRFCHKRKFWSYCGFAVKTTSSSDWFKDNGDWKRKKTTLTRGLNQAHNAIMKEIFKSAAKTVIDSKNLNEPLYSDYLRLLDQGTKPPMAQLTIARKLAATVLAMWKRQEAYKPSEYRSAKNSAA